ncbi:putative gustatory receptor 28b isoform X2 [Tribolium madens]|uniref:putative gustatory receptor 28b isoform X2 n=1 Tax=Tribolium madens TaxID=41895 RepID=UPI001CF761D5|nr:putative gustatory receptor 28b isoform X2 [Tribolium madens]
MKQKIQQIFCISFPKRLQILTIQLFSMQLLDEEVEFWACGVFIINETLLFSMVGAITSYLIIVFQMDNDNK